MNDKSPLDLSSQGPLFAGRIGSKASRKLRARRGSQSVWFGLGMMGLVGWSIVLPTMAGILIGIWLDQPHTGKHPWTIALLVAGLLLGCLNAWRWIAKEDRAIRKEQEESDE